MNCIGLGLGAACLGLAAGDIDGGLSPQQDVVTVTVCAPKVIWTKEDQAAAAAELRKLPPKHPLRIMGKNYIKQRDIISSCKPTVEGTAR